MPTIAPITAALAEAGVALFMPPETKWYQVDAVRDEGVQQFLVTDPDGYLLRFQSLLSTRPTAG